MRIHSWVFLVFVHKFLHEHVSINTVVINVIVLSPSLSTGSNLLIIKPYMYVTLS